MPAPPQPNQKDSNTPQAQLLQQNINDLARVVSSEARGVSSSKENAMVGWTIVNRMKKYGWTTVSAAWHGYSHRHSPDYSSLQIATAILTGRTADISQGATHFHSPSTMPKEGEPTVGFDTHGELKSVPGVMKDGRPVRNYRPPWAKPEYETKTPGLNESEFKFYKLPSPEDYSASHPCWPASSSTRLEREIFRRKRVGTRTIRR